MKKKIIIFIAIIVFALLPVFASCDSIFKPTTDYKTLVNKITSDIMPSNVIFKATYYYKEMGHTNYVTYSGSGVIISQGESYSPDLYVYYALTNNHVVNKTIDKHNVSSKEITVNDYKGNVIESENVYVIKSLASYDLALVRFVSEHKLSVIEFSENDVLARNDDVFAIGQPLSQINAITIGTVVAVNEVAPETSDVDSHITSFKVISHTAHIDEGSSGGMLLDKQLKLCGINYAGSTGTASTTSYAIPISAVRVFLSGLLDL